MEPRFPTNFFYFEAAACVSSPCSFTATFICPDLITLTSVTWWNTNISCDEGFAGVTSVSRSYLMCKQLVGSSDVKEPVQRFFDVMPLLHASVVIMSHTCGADMHEETTVTSFNTSQQRVSCAQRTRLSSMMSHMQNIFSLCSLQTCRPPITQHLQRL